MCALFGWMDYGKKLPYRTLRRLTQALANAAEERGTDASGISYVDHGKIEIYKKPMPAHRVKFYFPKNIFAVMGHTRMATQGKVEDNFNNHPFRGTADKEFALAHNGVLHNDKELRKDMNLPQTHIETDSYIAVQMLEKYGKINFENLKLLSERVSGSFCFTLLDAYNALYIIKGNNPMCLLHFPKFDLYVYASTESIVRNALRKVNMLKQTFEKIQMLEGDMVKISPNGTISRAEYEVQENYPLYPCYDWYEDYECQNEQEQILIDICGCYGVDEADVALLLDYGYTPEEIEEMLCDHSLLYEALGDIKLENDYFDYATL